MGIRRTSRVVRWWRSGLSALALGGALLVSTTLGASAHPSWDDRPVWYYNNQTLLTFWSHQNRVKSHIQLNTPGGHPATLINTADVENWCATECNDFAIAVQINIIRVNGQADTLHDTATAIDHTATKSTTEAWALQYNLVTNNVDDAADQLHDPVRTANHQLDWVQDHARHLTASQIDTAVTTILNNLQSEILTVAANSANADNAAPAVAPHAASLAPHAASAATPSIPLIPLINARHQVTGTING